MKIELRAGKLDISENEEINNGFKEDSLSKSAPVYDKSNFSFLIKDEEGTLLGALTSNILWDWLYIDELWVRKSLRGQGLGKSLILAAEKFAIESKLSGIYLWTQSWQAESFYKNHDYHEFARFPDFPKGYERIGFRKILILKDSHD